MRRQMHFGERLGLLLQVLIERIRVHPRAHVAAHVRALLVEHDQLVRARDRQLAQQDLIDEREDGGVGADAERERQDRDGREQGTAAESAERQAQVGQDAHGYWTEEGTFGLIGVGDSGRTGESMSAGDRDGAKES